MINLLTGYESELSLSSKFKGMENSNLFIGQLPPPDISTWKRIMETINSSNWQKEETNIAEGKYYNPKAHYTTRIE